MSEIPTNALNAGRAPAASEEEKEADAGGGFEVEGG